MRKMILLSSLVILIFSSCKTSYITSTWKSEGNQKKTYSKVLVVAIIREEDRALQQKMEQHMADDLVALGYNAVSSFAAFGPKAFKGMSKEEAVNKVKQDGVDAVITIVLLKKEAVKNYYPGHPHYWPSNTYYQDFGRYYTTISILIREPDYYVVNTKYNWESNFYDLGSQDLVYSVQTQSFDPVSTEDLANEYGKMIVKNMFKMGIIEKQKKLKAF